MTVHGLHSFAVNLSLSNTAVCDRNVMLVTVMYFFFFFSFSVSDRHTRKKSRESGFFQQESNL